MEHKEKIKIFYCACLVFIGTILFASFLPPALMADEFLFFCLTIILLAILPFAWQNEKIRIYALAAAFASFALGYYAFHLPNDALDKIWHYNGEAQILRGLVDKEPDLRLTSQKLEIAVRALAPDYSRKISGRVLVTTERFPAFAYGDELEIACELKKPEPFSGFSYDRYLARSDIYSVCYYPKITKIKSQQALNLQQKFYKYIFAFKDKARALIGRGLNDAEANLAKAIILGDKSALSAEWRALFSAAGISHIVAISGMHISILSALAMAFFIGIGLKRKHAFYLAVLFLAMYIIIIGLPASAMRAGLMGFCVLWALKLGRISKLINALLLAAVILLLLNPFLIRDDVGFQLSFLAVLGISYIYPRIKNFFEKIFSEKIYNLKIVQAVLDILGITLAAQVFTLPIIYYNFGSISLVAPLTNLLVLWALPFLMIALLLGLFLAWLLPAWLVIIFFPAKILLCYILIVAQYLGTMQYAVFSG